MSNQKKIKGGFIIIARQLLEREFTGKPPSYRDLWIVLLFKAAFRPSNYKGMKLKRGEVYTTVKELRDGLHWFKGAIDQSFSEDQIKKNLRKMASALMVSYTVAQGKYHIKLLKYNHYQDIKNYEGTGEGTGEGTSPYNIEGVKEDVKESSISFISKWDSYKKGDLLLREYYKYYQDGTTEKIFMEASLKKAADNLCKKALAEDLKTVSNDMFNKMFNLKKMMNGK